MTDRPLHGERPGDPARKPAPDAPAKDDDTQAPESGDKQPD
ncbi:hypothetical protein N4G40_10350 [Pantoea eucrina]|uniref:Uncharacterized protein n=1 Tax=Pantoea eucrina TaxID=472693 RepID=A0ABU5LFD8_9GAMM|nr:hypothetical protein [Pantoea eucrina]MDZ7278670.1 hypothetical protein [Pantoea eucrina]